MLGVVAHAHNPSTWKDEAGGLWVQGQPGLYSKTLYQKQIKSDSRNERLIEDLENKVEDISLEVQKTKREKYKNQTQ
jgi:hypothetical protein